MEVHSRERHRGTGFGSPHMPVQIFQFTRVQCKDWWTLVQIPGSSFQSPSFQNTPTQIPVSRFQGQFPVDLAHQYRFQISGSKGWSGSQIRRKQNPGSSIQIGPVSRFQYPDYRIQGGWRGRSGRGRLQIQIRRFWGGRGGAGTEKQGTDSRIRASLGTSQNSRFQALSLHPKS